MFAVLMVALVAGLSACTPEKSTPAGESLPPAEQLLAGAATEMGQVKTARFVLESDHSSSSVPVRRADGHLTREGNAQGTVQLDQSGALIELTFVVVDKTVYIKGATGGYQKIPLALASSVYDPSAILDPQRGAAKVMSTVKQVRTEAREKVGDTDAYRIAVTFDPTTIGAIVPGAGEGVTGQVWIGADRKLLLKAKVVIPGQQGAPATTVTVTFSEYDQPVTISAPQ
jgi:lipoprotein LprG